MLTKLDIMDPGTDARDILDNAAVRLKHGWIGVINRGQADINSRVRGHLGLLYIYPIMNARSMVQSLGQSPGKSSDL